MTQVSYAPPTPPADSPAGVFFDLDGTLVDTAPDFHRTLNQLLDEAGRKKLSLADVKGSISGGSRLLVMRGFDMAEGHPRVEPLRQRLLDLYREGVARESRLYPQFDTVLELLEARGIPWGIVTNKPRRFSDPLLRALGLSERMAALVCADDLPVTKPHPDPVLKAAADAGVDPARCWYAGDHERDIHAGNDAGMLTIAACYGYLESDARVANWQADYTIHSGADFLQLLRDALHQ